MSAFVDPGAVPASSNRPLVWRAGLVLVAAMVLAWVAVSPPVVPPVDALPVNREAAMPSVPAAMRAPVSGYADIARAPLFHPTRQPWVAPPPARQIVAPRPVSLMQYQLAGVVVSADGRSALLRSAHTSKTILLREGESLDGWTLRKVTQEAATFDSEGVQYDVRFPQANPITE